MVDHLPLATHGERERGGFEEDGEKLGLEFWRLGVREQRGEQFHDGGAEVGEGVVEVWGWRVGVGEEGEDFVRAA